MRFGTFFTESNPPETSLDKKVRLPEFGTPHLSSASRITCTYNSLEFALAYDLYRSVSGNIDAKFGNESQDLFLIVIQLRIS